MNKTISEEIQELTNAQKQDFEIKKENEVLINSTTVLNFFDIKYGEFTMPKTLYNSWILYKSLTITDLIRAYDAFYAEYNPIDNYDGVEEVTHLEKHGTVSKTSGGSSTETSTANNITTVNSVAPFDTTDMTNDDKSVNSGSSENIISSDNSETTEYNDTTLGTDTAHDITKDTIRKHGNIGVTMTQQMIREEIELRFKPVIIEYLTRFVYEYGYLYKPMRGCGVI